VQQIHDLRQQLKGQSAFHAIIGKNHKMREIYGLIEQVADSSASVLIHGESGTGKELVARAIYQQGPRRERPFVAVNCAALVESLLESELFGHVKGAFTGALNSKLGRFEIANGGTIFLDEIGDISPLIQVKLLRVLQDKE
jgi:two-component system, NtrC family, response regulator HydG